MRYFFLSTILLISTAVWAQHCPWDCSGMLLFKTDITPEKIYKLHPVLVDENKNIVADTVYGTGLPTYDTCNLLYYDDFLSRRTEKIQTHHWYAYDTVYHFAEGFYIIRTNFCKYRNKKLFLRLTDADNFERGYKFVEIDNNSLVHLHNYSMEINDGKTNDIKEAISKKIIILNCSALGIKEKDCN